MGATLQEHHFPPEKPKPPKPASEHGEQHTNSFARAVVAGALGGIALLTIGFLAYDSILGKDLAYRGPSPAVINTLPG
jgi:hypothetical protein